MWRRIARAIVNRLPGNAVLRRWLARREALRAVQAWEARGRPAPPPHLIKQRALRDIAKSLGLTVFVETGTYQGEMIAALQDDFETLYTIELSPQLYAAAVQRFRKQPHVHLIQGDSGAELGRLVGQLDRPALFWLDGHYSGGITALGSVVCPIYEELATLLPIKDVPHLIVIDDARLFGTDPGYPTPDALCAFIRSHRPDLEITRANDSFRLIPRAYQHALRAA